MSTSSSKFVLNQEYKAVQKKRVWWLGLFLKRTFFGTCPDHNLQKNELNRYCINCDLAACRYCISSGAHGQHKLLKIYRHVYKDVVPLDEMEIHMDCTKIQRYKCNKRDVIALKPLPHCGSGEAFKETSCAICNRKLLDPNLYCYCSIACQVKANSPFYIPKIAAEDYNVKGEGKSRRKRKRKGIPHRSPI